jgi:hypothetical protein
LPADPTFSAHPLGRSVECEEITKSTPEAVGHRPTLLDLVARFPLSIVREEHHQPASRIDNAMIIG